MFTSSEFNQKCPFLSKFGPKVQNCLKVKFGT